MRKDVHRQHKDPDTNTIGVRQYLSGKSPDPVLLSTTRTLLLIIVSGNIYPLIFLAMIKYTVWICSVGTHKPGTIDSVILSMTRMLSRCNTADLQHRFALQNIQMTWEHAIEEERRIE